MRRRLPLHLLLLAGVALAAITLGGRFEYTAADTLAALRTASPRARCIVYWEVGRGSRLFAPYDPNAIGDSGTSYGAVQLHEGGLLADFYAQGYRDPFDPYQAVTYLDEALGRGLAAHWSPVKLGYC